MLDYKNREIFNEIINYLKIPEIIVAHGARQVGKTTLIRMIIYFGEKYKVNDLYCVTLNKNENSRFKKIKQIYPWEIEKLGMDA